MTKEDIRISHQTEKQKENVAIIVIAGIRTRLAWPDETTKIKNIFMVCTGTKINIFFIVILIPKLSLSWSVRDPQLQQYRAAVNKKHSGLHRYTSPKLWGRQRCPMTARSISKSRASCCCPCGLASVVTVAAGTTWGDATPCYASHMMWYVK